MTDVLLSALAQADIRDIRRYGVTQFGSAVGNAYVDGFASAFDRIAENPQDGRVQPAYRVRLLRSVPYRRHRIFYDVEGEEVRIVRILHQAMDFDRHLN